MRQKIFKRLVLGLSFHIMAPTLIYAAPASGLIRPESIKSYDYDIDTPNKIAFPESVINEDTYILMDTVVEASDNTEHRTFLDYFPDPDFAQGVSEILNKESTDFITEEALSDIIELSLSNYNITTIKGIQYLTGLQRLDLKRNQIVEIPDTIGELKKLYQIFLNDNCIGEIPDSIGQLSNLRYLYLSNNSLDEISDSIGQLKKLQYLDLSGNQINKIPDFIKDLSMLNL